MTRVEQVLAFLRQHADSRLIKLITGMRGCGKTYAVNVWIERLRADGVPAANVIRCDLESPSFRTLHETEPLVDWIEARMPKDESAVHVILDEVCQCHEYEAVIGVLHAMTRVNLILVCSNARPVSSGLGRYLDGHGVTMEMLPPAFAEVTLPKRFGFEERLDHVLHYGALPYLDLYRGSSVIDELGAMYLQGLWNTILVKDILSRNRLSDSRLTEKLLGRLYDHLGENESLRRIAADTTMDGREAAPNTVETYLSALDESLLVRKLTKFDVFDGEERKAGYRVYLTDLALGANRYGEFPGDPTNAIRNLIALELAGRGGKVYGGRYDGSDFDFVSIDKGRYACWQFVPDLVDGAVPTPLISGLKRVPDDVPRYVICRKELPKRRAKGLEYVTLEAFFMNRGSEEPSN